MEMQIDIIDIGDEVVCDLCNDDYTFSDEQGGVLVNSSAYCPNCAKNIMADLMRYGETKYLQGRCPIGMTYHDWVMQLRGGDNTIKIFSGDVLCG